jgi:hypothetical protein
MNIAIIKKGRFLLLYFIEKEVRIKQIEIIIEIG